MSFFQFQEFIDKYKEVKVHGPKRKLLIGYLATLSDSDKKSLLRQLRFKKGTVEKLLATK